MTTREHSVEYKEYLNSKEWKQRRWHIILLANNRCQRCGADGMKTPLQVHHVTYDRLGAELDSDLMAVCKPCHDKEDAKRAAEVKHVQIRRLYNARFEGWANAVYGEGWRNWQDEDEAQDRFEDWLDRNGYD